MSRSSRNEWRRATNKAVRPEFDPSLAPSIAEQRRIGMVLRRVRYRDWRFSLAMAGGIIDVAVFRPDPEDPKRLRMLGPWPIPPGADDDAIAAITLDAAISVDGESAREHFVFLPLCGEPG